MTAESHLDDLVARINDYLQRWPYRDGMYSHLENARDAIVALRARADEAGQLADTWQAAAVLFQAEVLALRTALRDRGAVKIPGPGDWGWCHLCNWGSWKHGEPERHATGCLAEQIEKDKGG